MISLSWSIINLEILRKYHAKTFYIVTTLYVIVMCTVRLLSDKLKVQILAEIQQMLFTKIFTSIFIIFKFHTYI